MEQPPFDTPLTLKEYLSRVLNALNNKDSQLIAPINAIPTKPAIGRLHYFSNATGVITKAGLWVYTALGWSNCDISNGGVSITSTGILGYGAGAGGSVTQITSKTTAVTLNTPTGLIITMPDNLAAGATFVFTVNNSLVLATDLICISFRQQITSGTYTATVCNTVAGSFVLAITNISAGALAENIRIRFGIIRSSNV